jgi:hypothetical protein
MKTGFDRLVAKIPDDKLCALFVTIMDNCVRLAEMYAIESGRNHVTVTDMVYALRHQCRHFTDDPNLIHHIENNRKGETDLGNSECSCYSEDDIDEFTRVESTANPVVVQMNEAFDTWDTWAPVDELEVSLRSTADHITRSIFPS